MGPIMEIPLDGNKHISLIMYTRWDTLWAARNIGMSWIVVEITSSPPCWMFLRSYTVALYLEIDKSKVETYF